MPFEYAQEEHVEDEVYRDIAEIEESREQTP